MSNERLKELLCQADEAAGAAPELGDGLAKRVRQLAWRRRMLRMTLPAAAAAILMIGFGMAYWLIGDTPSPPDLSNGGIFIVDNKNQEAEQLKLELVQLQKEADTQRQIIAMLLEKQRQEAELVSLETELAEMSDPLDEVFRQVEQAAYTVFYHAEQKYTQMNLRDSAIADYRQIIKLYPQTRWARVAQSKLKEIGLILEGAHL